MKRILSFSQSVHVTYETMTDLNGFSIVFYRSHSPYTRRTKPWQTTASMGLAQARPNYIHSYLCKYKKEITIIVQSHQSPLSTSGCTRYYGYIDTRDNFGIGSITWYDQVCMHNEIQYGYGANVLSVNSVLSESIKTEVFESSMLLDFIYSYGLTIDL